MGVTLDVTSGNTSTLQTIWVLGGWPIFGVVVGYLVFDMGVVIPEAKVSYREVGA